MDNHPAIKSIKERQEILTNYFYNISESLREVTNLKNLITSINNFCRATQAQSQEENKNLQLLEEIDVKMKIFQTDVNGKINNLNNEIDKLDTKIQEYIETQRDIDDTNTNWLKRILEAMVRLYKNEDSSQLKEDFINFISDKNRNKNYDWLRGFSTAKSPIGVLDWLLAIIEKNDLEFIRPYKIYYHGQISFFNKFYYEINSFDEAEKNIKEFLNSHPNRKSSSFVLPEILIFVARITDIENSQIQCITLTSNIEYAPRYIILKSKGSVVCRTITDVDQIDEIDEGFCILFYYRNN